MKQEYPTSLKTIGKSKALAATVDPTDGGSKIVDDEEDLVDSKFEKMDEQNDIHTTYEKLYNVSKKHEIGRASCRERVCLAV